jgi:hypothetical protein
MHPTRRALLIGGSALGILPGGRAHGRALRLSLATRSPVRHPAARFRLPPAVPARRGGIRQFCDWLRGLPLKPAGAPVLLFNGAPKFRQDVHAAVIDIDVGTRDPAAVRGRHHAACAPSGCTP